MTRATSETERPAFLAASFVVAVHTVADAVLAPEPGTRWADHLVAAGATLALLVLAVLLWRRTAPAKRPSMCTSPLVVERRRRAHSRDTGTAC